VLEDLPALEMRPNILTTVQDAYDVDAPRLAQVEDQMFRIVRDHQTGVEVTARSAQLGLVYKQSERVA